MTVRTAVLASGYRSLIRPALFRRHGGDAEAVHEDMINDLARLGASRSQRAIVSLLCGKPDQPQTVAGVRFPGRVGVAAGLDKNGKAAAAWSALGFGFAELGTVTGLPQPGNDRPRLFRLPASRAIINRMGFNNEGAQALAQRLNDLGVRRGEATVGIPLGISLGKSKVVPIAQAVSDYVASLRIVARYADYVAINVSSPNTPGLRDLQDAGLLRDLVDSLVRETRQISHALGPLPVFVKIAPDLSDADIDRILQVVTDHGGRGVIATNTTISRDGLAPADASMASESGGLSGAPLTARALEVVTRVAGTTTLPVIGVGGIMTTDDAQRMFDAGARLVQVYTGFVYAGPALVAGINHLAIRRKS